MRTTFGAGIIVAALLLSSLGNATPISDSPPWGAWARIQVHEGRTSGLTQTVIALDSEDRPHFLSANTSMPQALLYHRPTAVGWAIETITVRAVSRDMAIDADDVPHIVYQAASGGALYYAYRTPSGWISEYVASGANFPRIALASDGTVHVAYGAGGLTHAWRAPMDGAWSTELIDLGGSSGVGWLDATVDDTDRLHVAYASFTGTTSGTTKYALLDSGSWHTETVDLTCGGGEAIAVDNDGRPSIACVTTLDGLFYYRLSDAGIWVKETVVGGYREADDPALAIDNNGTPHLAFWRYKNPGFGNDPTWPGELKYAAKVDGVWGIERVDRIGQNTGRNPDLKLDSAGRPHISYELYELVEGQPGIAPGLGDLMYTTPAVGFASSVARQL